MPRRDHDERYRQIVTAVRELCAEQGVSKLSVTDITERVGVTRSLFYHYFPDKDAAISAAIDEIIEQFMVRIRAWNESRVPGDVEGALNSCAGLFCDLVLEGDEHPSDLVGGGNAALYTSYVHRVADRVANYICETTVRDFEKRHGLPIDHVYETFYVLIVGLMMYIRMHPDAPVETIRDVAASTLHIEGYLSKYR